jgi:hypothetical protein
MSVCSKVTVIDRNHPEFDKIAKEITPINRVHTRSQMNTYIDAERDNSAISKKRRRESPDKLRG